MSKKLLTEEDVKKELGITDFRSISKEKIVSFVNMMPKLDKELAINIIEQFPSYVTMANSMVDNLISLCNNALQDAKVAEVEAINAYKVVLETIRKELEDGIATPEERETYNKQMIEVADKISEIDARKKRWLSEVVKTGRDVVVVTLVIGASILGVNVAGKLK